MRNKFRKIHLSKPFKSIYLCVELLDVKVPNQHCFVIILVNIREGCLPFFSPVWTMIVRLGTRHKESHRVVNDACVHLADMRASTPFILCASYTMGISRFIHTYMQLMMFAHKYDAAGCTRKRRRRRERLIVS